MVECKVDAIYTHSRHPRHSRMGTFSCIKQYLQTCHQRVSHTHRISHMDRKPWPACCESFIRLNICHTYQSAVSVLDNSLTVMIHSKKKTSGFIKNKQKKNRCPHLNLWDNHLTLHQCVLFVYLHEKTTAHTLLNCNICKEWTSWVCIQKHNRC